jgi:hypothetical protein
MLLHFGATLLLGTMLGSVGQHRYDAQIEYDAAEQQQNLFDVAELRVCHLRVGDDPSNALLVGELGLHPAPRQENSLLRRLAITLAGPDREAFLQQKAAAHASLVAAESRVGCIGSGSPGVTL